MFTVEIKVNGSIVNAIDAHNTGRINADGLTRYDYRMARFPIDQRLVQTHHGNVHHRREDGIERLVEKIIAHSLKKGSGTAP
jgi:hypothetical protein